MSTIDPAAPSAPSVAAGEAVISLEGIGKTYETGALAVEALRDVVADDRTG